MNQLLSWHIVEKSIQQEKKWILPFSLELNLYLIRRFSKNF